MKKNKCQCSILYKSKYRKCKGNVYFIYNNQYYCWNHSIKLFSKKIIKIQSLFRGRQCRKKINNLFIKLPKDIQNIVCYYIRQEHYYNKYITLCNNIINNKIHEIDKLILEPPDGWIDHGSNLIILNEYNTLSIIHNIINIYNIMINNWNNINFNIIKEKYLIILFNFSKLLLWGTTVWNSISLYNTIMNIFRQNKLLTNNFNKITLSFQKLWNDKFIYHRINMYEASIIIR
jgi:hypothetical protein